MSKVPWSVDTPSVNGRKAEKQKAKQYGAKLHSNSGAGVTKNDFSTEDAVYEDKNVNRTHTIKGDDLKKLFSNAASQGKSAVYVVYFEEANVTLEGVVRIGN